MLNSEVASYPVTNSLAAGVSGSAFDRVGVVSASARSLPVLVDSITPASPVKDT
jgi:hypothetical protein